MKIIGFLLIVFIYCGCSKPEINIKPHIKFIDSQGKINKKEAHFYGALDDEIVRIKMTDDTCRHVFKEVNSQELSEGSFLRLKEGLNMFYLQVSYRNGSTRCFGEKPLAVFSYQPVLKVDIFAANHNVVVKNMMTGEQTNCISKCSVKAQKGDNLRIEPKDSKGNDQWSKNCGILKKSCHIQIQKPERVIYQ